ncbi:expressed unknown protein [Seminavis robusta]|uniref:Secreted protein n=1 Tax=Seminavis robusta TaxID=568900 RepID=A0A9N8ERR5_9STRA|nr:expressed unknown protein [Seminavis robusta]|eukprot:Sro1519_g279270.1 n/a (168) ;mRNA; r:5833-6336
MKNLLLVSVACLLFCHTAHASCTDIQLTLNLKPKYPYGITDGTDCTDEENAEIASMISSKVTSVLASFGFPATVGSVSDVDCPTIACTTNPGHKCEPRCATVKICLTGSAASQVPSFSDSQLGELAQQEIDSLRSSLPACLGVKNQFMLDIHSSVVGSSSVRFIPTN